MSRRVSRRALLIVSVFVLLISVVKGIAFPHNWAASHLLFTYERGFVKRALLGELAKRFWPSVASSYEVFFYVSVVILCLNIALFVVVFVQLGRSRHAYLRYASPVFASSLAVVYLANTIGYFDQLGLLATFLAIMIDGFWRRFAFVAVVFSFLLFVHEATFVIFLPVILVTFLLETDLLQKKRRVGAVLVLGAGLTVVTYLVSRAAISKPEAEAMFQAAGLRANYVVNHHAFEVLHRSGWDNLDIMTKAWARSRHVRFVVYGLVACLPTAFLLQYLSAKTLRRYRVSWVVVGLVVLAGSAPLSLHAFGWDIYRWPTLAITTSFLGLYAVVRRFRFSEADGWGAPVPRWFPALCALLFAFNASSSLTGINGREVQPFPFRHHTEYWIRVYDGKAEFPEVPRPPKKKKKKKKSKQKLKVPRRLRGVR